MIRLSMVPAKSALIAFLAALRTVGADSPTACVDWDSHALLAHLTAGSAEIADLIELALRAESRPTRAFAERERPYVALPDDQLRRRFVTEGMRLSARLSKLRKRGLTIDFTGTALDAHQIARHAESELVLHRYDLVGLDGMSRRLLSAPALREHVRSVVASMEAGVLPSRSARTATDDANELLAIWGR